ncbi:hypothetical protein [Stenotrophomonas sp.]|uniref:hypothetical protein n=1 Tax=Stenotrophomonas sp. TaxID=69392 RepID=UPI0028B15380|nr:hypothetical protein [Stenotrophomonas sp.]
MSELVDMEFLIEEEHLFALRRLARRMNCHPDDIIVAMMERVCERAEAAEARQTRH